MRAPSARPAPGTRPVSPVRQDETPDDRWCTWVYRLDEWTPGSPRTGFWELKFVSAACSLHNRLAA